MNKIILVLLVSVAGLVAFAGYFTVLVDWIQDFSTGFYKQHFVEAILETVGLVIYTYLGVRFFNRNLGSFR